MAGRSQIVKRIIEGLKTIIEANNRFECEKELAKITTAATNVLFETYEAGVSNITFTSEEKKAIAPLIPPALLGLGYNFGSLYGCNRDWLRIERSGLQFLMDMFKDCPASTEDESKTLEEVFREFLELEEMEDTDNELRTAPFQPEVDDRKRSASFKAEIAKLPSTHTWFLEK